MCWNAEVSLQSFLIGITAVFFANQNGLPFPTTLFCLTIVFMQLIEYFVWSYYDNPTVNFVASFSAAFLLFLQPVASLLTLSSKYTTYALLVYVGLALAAFVVMDMSRLREKYKMRRAENGHLAWNWIQNDLQTTLSLVVYFLFLFTPLLLRGQYTLLGISLTTLFVSLYSFYKENTWGSMWCWIVNYIVVGICGYQILVAKP